MLTAALSATAKTWTQPKHPLKGDWIKQVWHTHVNIMKHGSAAKKNKRRPFAATCMALDYHSN